MKMKGKILYGILVMIISLASCKKENDTTNNVSTNNTNNDSTNNTTNDYLETGWQKKILPSGTNNSYIDIFFVDPLRGYTASTNGVYKSSDGGTNWDKVVAINSADCYFTDIYFTDSRHGWACAVGGQTLRYIQ